MQNQTVRRCVSWRDRWVLRISRWLRWRAGYERCLPPRLTASSSGEYQILPRRDKTLSLDELLPCSHRVKTHQSKKKTCYSTKYLRKQNKSDYNFLTLKFFSCFKHSTPVNTAIRCVCASIWMETERVVALICLCSSWWCGGWVTLFLNGLLTRRYCTSPCFYTASHQIHNK